jgi:ribosomal protein S28E/S33
MVRGPIMAAAMRLAVAVPSRGRVLVRAVVGPIAWVPVCKCVTRIVAQ